MQKLFFKTKLKNLLFGQIPCDVLSPFDLLQCDKFDYSCQFVLDLDIDLNKMINKTFNLKQELDNMKYRTYVNYFNGLIDKKIIEGNKIVFSNKNHLPSSGERKIIEVKKKNLMYIIFIAINFLFVKILSN